MVNKPYIYIKQFELDMCFILHMLVGYPEASLTNWPDSWFYRGEHGLYAPLLNNVLRSI